MNAPTLIIAAAIAAVVTLIIVREIKNRRDGKGGCSCGCSCDGCTGCDK